MFKLICILGVYILYNRSCTLYEVIVFIVDLCHVMFLSIYYLMCLNRHSCCSFIFVYLFIRSCVTRGLVISRAFFFFFKQKTAYEMRISDWSSDVCSSD